MLALTSPLSLSFSRFTSSHLFDPVGEKFEEFTHDKLIGFLSCVTGFRFFGVYAGVFRLLYNSMHIALQPCPRLFCLLSSILHSVLYQAGDS